MTDFTDPTLPGPANGEVRGDSKSMPDRGTSSGFVGTSGSYGADTSESATNRMGSAHLDSDPIDRCYPNGDADLRFTAGGHGSKDPGSHFSGGSDAQAEVMPEDPRGAPDPDNS